VHVFELTVVGLIVFNGLLAMSELTLVSAKRPLLQQMSRDGSRGAGVALDLTREPGRMLSAVQIGITLVGIVAGAFSVPPSPSVATPGSKVRVCRPQAGQLAQRRAGGGDRRPADAAPRQGGGPGREPARPVGPAWAPSARGQTGQRETSVTDEEIITMIEEAERACLVEPEERSMISRVMRLGDRPVRAIMTPRQDIEWIDLNDSEDEIREAIRSARHGRMLVANGDIDEIVGALPVRAALVALMDEGVSAMWILVEKVPAVSDRLAAIDVVEKLRQSPVNLVVIVDQHGSVEGIVTEGDILKAVVADIEEEEKPHVTERDDGSLLIDGSCPVDEIAERLGISLPPNHSYHTVAGFALNRMKRLPRIGESFSHGLWRFEVLDIDGTRIDKVLVTPHPTLHRSI
jgi:putative hemolysin